MIFTYKTTNMINGKIYIGVHKTNNINDGYIGSGLIISRAIKKYGKENFKREILEEFDTLAEAYLEESKIVNESFVNRSDTYNITIGGDGGWYHTKGKIVVKDKDGNTMQVSVDDPRYLSGELVGVCKGLKHPGINLGMVTAKDANGNIIKVSVDDPQYLSGKLVHMSKGYVTVKDKDGNTMQVSVDDPRYLSGELQSNMKGMLHAKDELGNKVFISKEEYQIQPNYTYHITNYATVKDKDGNTMQVSVDDPRYLSGELVGVMKGRSFSHKNPRKKIECPHCKKVGDSSNMKRWHFDNCKFKS
jgi:hypothetical protein